MKIVLSLVLITLIFGGFSLEARERRPVESPEFLRALEKQEE